MLKDYQYKGINFLLSNPNSGLFFEPGLGKTLTFLTYLKILQDTRQSSETKPCALVIAPIHACNLVWPHEVQKWPSTRHLSVGVLRGDNREDVFKEDHDIHVIDFHSVNLVWLVKMIAKHKRFPWKVLCVDESTKFKNYKSTRIRALKAMLPKFKYRHILTGTPSPNGLIDLYGQMFILDQGKALGEKPSHYEGAYFTWSRRKHKHLLLEGHEHSIYQAIEKNVLTMKAIDHLDLPEITYNYLKVEMPEDARKVYNKMESSMFLSMSDKDEILAASAGVKYNYCWQIASGRIYIPEGDDEIKIRDTLDFSKLKYPLGNQHPGRPTYRDNLVIHNAKQEVMANLIEELNGKPLLIAYMFNHEQLAILEKLESMGMTHNWYHGDKPWYNTDIAVIGKGTKDKEAENFLQMWNRRELKVLLCQPASVSHGLNLQFGGRDILWYSTTDNFEEYEQFNKRLHRQGVDSRVRVHHLCVENTIDDMKAMRIRTKDQSQLNLKDALIMYQQTREQNDR